MLNLFGNKSAQIEEFLGGGAVILDVRSKSEFESGHLKTAINIPLDSLPQKLGQLDKSKPIITCCASGMRSSSAKRILKAKGFKVMNRGGWMSLQKYE